MTNLPRALSAALFFACLFAANSILAQNSKPSTVFEIQKNTQFERQSPITKVPDANSRAADTMRERICQNLEPKLERNWYPAFDWSMPARYGHDRKLYDDGTGGKVGNGIIDLPNTKEYVANTISYSDNREDACSCEPQADGTCEARFKVHLFKDGLREAGWQRVASSLRKQRDDNQCPAISIPDKPGAPDYRWSINGSDSFSLAGRNRVEVCLTEGHHAITLDMVYPQETRSVTRHIEVIDHLIVNMGDSYGAGEGTPEKNYRPRQMRPVSNMRVTGPLERVDWTENYIEEHPFFAQWADPGVEIPMVDYPLKAYSDIYAVRSSYDGKPTPVLIQKQEEETYRRTVRMPDWDKIKKQFYNAGQPDNHPLKVLMDHHHAHRSSATGASQLALHLEHHDDKSSVTFVNVAASGATMSKGVLAPYKGVHELKFSGNVSDYLPRHQNKDGLQPQIAHVADMIGDRSIDHLYLSVGGNDVGFANVIEIFMAAHTDDPEEYDKTVEEMIRLLHSGRWDIGNFEWSLIEGAMEHKDRVLGLDNLYQDYQYVNGNLADLVANEQFSGDVTLISYPDLSSSFRQTDPSLKVEDLDGLPSYFCNIEVDKYEDPTLHREWFEYSPTADNLSAAAPINIDLDFNSYEFRIAHKDVVVPLFEHMSEAVDRLNALNTPVTWSLLDQGELPRYHGICGTSYNRFDFQRQISRYNAANRSRGTYLTNTAAEDKKRAWYRSPQAGAGIQRGEAVTNTGLFHPNEFGYRHVGRRVMEELEFYGAEYEDDSYITGERRNQFIDVNDSISEGRRLSRLNTNDSFRGTLIGSQDASAYRVLTTGQRCEPISISLNDAGKEAGLAIWVFNQNGEKLHSSHDNPKQTSSFGRVEIQGQPSLAGRLRVVDDRIEHHFDQMKDAQFGGRFCPVEAYTKLEQKRIDDSKTGTVSVLAEHRDEIGIVIAHGDNRKFDPVTGRGDNRIDMDRDAISFRGGIFFE